MKFKKILAMVLCLAMVLSTMGTVAFAEDAAVNNTPSEEAQVVLDEATAPAERVEVTTYEELIAALAEDKANVVMMNDITATATQNSGYGVAGIVVEAGDTLDGNNKKLTINGANGTWDCAVAIKGGTVKNLTIAGAMRGVFMPGANGDVVIDNCVFKDVIYTFNSDAGSKDYTVTVKNSALNGWTSYSAVHKAVTFENCKFGEGSGYAFCRPYNETTFTGCEFNEGFKIDMRATQTFNECKYDGEALGVNNINKLFIDDNDGKNVIIDNEEVTLNKKAVAYIGLTGYEKLADAIKAAVNGDTITLVNDYAGDVTISKNITLDGANKNYTGKITISGNYKVSINNVNFVGGDHYAIETSGPNTVTVEKCTINNYSYGFFYAKKSTANVVIKNVTVENCNYGFSWNYGINATLENVKMTNVKYGVFVQNWDDKTVTLKNCEILATYPVFVWEKDTATQTFVFEGENNFGTTEFAISDYATLKLANADATLTACADLEVATDNEKYNVIYENGIYKIEKLVKIGETYYPCLQEAICAAQPGDTITLLGNITEKVVIEAPAVAALSASNDKVVIDLAGNTLNGYILIKDASKVIEIKNGNIVNEDSAESAVESVGNITLTNVNITSKRHAIRVDGNGTAVIDGGIYKLNNTENMSIYTVNASANAVVTIKDGTFIGDGGLNEASAAVASRDNAVVTIYGGTYSNGVPNTLSGKEKKNIVVYHGIYDQDPSDYLAEGYVATVNAVSGLYEVSAEGTKASEIKVVFEEVASTDEDIKVYNIVLKADSDINEFASAELTFINNSELLEGGVLPYVITPAEDMTLSTVSEKPGYYGFAMEGDTEYEISGDKIILGKVTFTGYGNLDFSVKDGIVNATTVMNNLVKTYVVGGSATTITKGNLIINTDILKEGTTEVEYPGIIDGEIKVPTRTLTINIDFPNAVENKAIAYQDMKVVISGGDLAKDITIDLGLDAVETALDIFGKADASFVAAMDNGSYVINVTDALTLNNAYTVTVSGAGYRTARYTVTMTEDKVLKFWNNVMDEKQFVEIGKESSKVNVTFLAGDIVKDNKINIYDLSAVVSYFGTEDCANNYPEYAKYDLNRDGVIDSKDVAYVLVSWNN